MYPYDMLRVETNVGRTNTQTSING